MRLGTRAEFLYSDWLESVTSDDRFQDSIPAARRVHRIALPQYLFLIFATK